MTGKISVVFAMIFTFTTLVVASVTIEQPIAHNTYVAPYGHGGTAGTVTGEPNESDGDWNTYTQVTSNGNATTAIDWHSEDEWVIPVGINEVWLNLKIEAPDPYVFQGHQDVLFWKWEPPDLDPGLESSWKSVSLSGSYGSDVPPPLSGMLDTSITVPPEYISATGEITTRVQLWQKHDTGSWSRLYETSLTYVPEPATLSLLAIGGLALLRRRRK